MKKYVLGYAFNKDLDNVILINKNRPEWMAGKLNGVGGKIEPGEEADDAMVREFEEETGIHTTLNNWCRVTTLRKRSEFEINVFTAVTDKIFECVSVTDEIVSVYSVQDIHLLGKKEALIYNVPWQIEMSLAKLYNANPFIYDIIVE